MHAFISALLHLSPSCLMQKSQQPHSPEFLLTRPSHVCSSTGSQCTVKHGSGGHRLRRRRTPPSAGVANRQSPSRALAAANIVRLVGLWNRVSSKPTGQSLPDQKLQWCAYGRKSARTCFKQGHCLETKVFYFDRLISCMYQGNSVRS